MKIPLKTALLTAVVVATSAQGAQILGIDVSSFNGSITWTSVAADGIKFAYVRSTQGTFFTDANYTANMVNGKAAGIQMGAYEFSEPAMNTPSQEANYFWTHAGAQIKNDGKSISPCIDFEEFSGHVGAATYTSWFNTWAVDVKAKTAAQMRPVILVAPCTGACDLTSSIMLPGYIVNQNGMSTTTPWTSCLSCNAWDVGGTGNWTFWLFSSGAISGISGEVDLDIYPGNLASLKSAEGVGN